MTVEKHQGTESLRLRRCADLPFDSQMREKRVDLVSSHRGRVKRTTAMKAMPGNEKSSVYFACPVTSRGSSRRLMPDPKIRDAMRASSTAHARRSFLNRRDDVLVTGAAAEGAFDPMAHIGFSWMGIAFDQIVCGHDHARRAEAALQAVLVPESLLHRVQLAVRGEAFDGGDARPVGLHRQHRARFDRLPVDQHCAGATLTGVAANVGPSEPQCLAQEMNQKQTRLDLGALLHAVDRDGNCMLHADLRADVSLSGARFPVCASRDECSTGT